MKKNGIKLRVFASILCCCIACKEGKYTVTSTYENTLEQNIVISFLNPPDLLGETTIEPHGKGSINLTLFESETLWGGVTIIKLEFEDGKSIAYSTVLPETDTLHTNLMNFQNYTDYGRYHQFMQITEKHYQEASKNEAAKQRQ